VLDDDSSPPDELSSKRRNAHRPPSSCSTDVLPDTKLSSKSVATVRGVRRPCQQTRVLISWKPRRSFLSSA
jgi:hypothetical protein